MRRYVLVGLALLTAALLAAGCSKRDAVGTVKAYLRAKIEDSDRDKMLSLSCAAWEANAIAESTSFATIDAKIEEMECAESGTDGEYTVVACEGLVTAVYGVGDVRQLDLGGPYRAIEENGEWKMCGVVVADE
jgi:hypothetical protein